MHAIPYRREIDGLRAVAVTAVLIYHADLGLRSGLVGVDVFFVISGYLITALLYTEWQATAHIDLWAFYARRARRLLPALATVCLSTLIAATMVLPPFDAMRDVADSSAAALLFAGNLFFQAHTGGYFDPAATHFPLLHTWSLGVEEQFYLLWPAGLLLLLRLRAHSLRIAIGLCGLASLAVCFYLAYYHPTAAFYQMPSRFWELAVGGLIATAPRSSAGGSRWIAPFGFFAILASFLFEATDFPSVPATLAVSGAALVIWCVHRSADLGAVGKLLGSTPFVAIGLISYSLYLWHWPLLALAASAQVEHLPMGVRIGLCLASVALAAASYRYVEKPLRRSDPTVPSRQVVIAALTVSASLAFASMRWGDFVYRDEPVDLIVRTERDSPANRDTCHFRGNEAIDVLPRASCTVGTGPVKVAIWGDSHALAWSPFAWAIAKQHHAAATSYSRDACPPALGYANGKRRLEETRCVDFNERVLRQIDGLDVLVFAALWPAGTPNAPMLEHFQSTLDQASGQVKKIIVLGPTPVFPRPVPECLRLGQQAACAIPRAQFDADTRVTREFLQTLARHYANVEYVDLTEFFCDASACRTVKNGYGVAWDKDHTSSSAAMAFAQEYLSR